MRGGKEHPYLQRQRDTGKNLNEQTLLSFPQFPHYVHTLLSYHIFHDFPLFSKPIKNLKSNYFFSSSLSYEGSVSLKVTIKSVYILFSC